MSLIWHMAKKDIRRMAVPVAVWIVLIVAPTIALVAVPPPVEGNTASAINWWPNILQAWIYAFSAVQWLIGYVLAGALVLEDPLTGTTAFWTTRPIANARLLAAKLLAATVLFLVAPALALLPVWVSSGFGAYALLVAAAEFAARCGPIVLVAIAIASVVRTLPQFLLASLAVTAAFMGITIVLAPLWQDAPMAVRRSRHELVSAAFAPAIMGIAAHQFLTRRATRTWVLIGCAIIATGIILLAWPWNFPRAAEDARRLKLATDDRGAEVVAEPTFRRNFRSPSKMPSLYGTTAWSPDSFHAPVFARTPDGTAVMRGRSWVYYAGLRTLGFKRDPEPLRWQLTQMGQPIAHYAPGEPHFVGTIEIWSIQTRVLGEAPLEAGAAISGAAQRTKIIALERHEPDDRLDAIYLEETEDHATASGSWTSNWSASQSERVRHIDYFYLVNRSAGTAQPCSPSDLGMAEMNSVVVRFRRLHVPGTPDIRASVLVKLRFECRDRFVRPLQVRGVVDERAAKP